MPSKLETFLKDKKIDKRQLLIASKHIESLQPEDRTIRLAKRLGAKAEDSDKKEKESRKPRSGKPITPVTLSKIFSDKPVNGPTRTRVLRAVNAILERKKQEKVDLTAIFDLTKSLPKRKAVVKADKRKK
jgi:hypothetical protein